MAPSDVIPGSNGQITFINCEFDGHALNDGGTNIWIGDGVTGLRLMPNTITFINPTIQLGTVGMSVNGCWSVNVIAPHIENLGGVFIRSGE